MDVFFPLSIIYIKEVRTHMPTIRATVSEDHGVLWVLIFKVPSGRYILYILLHWKLTRVGDLGTALRTYSVPQHITICNKE